MSRSVESTIIAFDLYGTLLSTDSIATESLAQHFGIEIAKKIATLWRRYQLEYTWRLNSMNQYQPFSEVTRSSLLHALAEFDLNLSPEDVNKTMRSYDCLSTYPDADNALEYLAASEGFDCVIFSNGTDDMVNASVKHSPNLKPYAPLFQKFVTVESVKRFKPDPTVYHHLAREVGVNIGLDHDANKKQMRRIWLISGNPFDIVGARAVNMNAVWINRSGGEWMDQAIAGDRGKPTLIVNGVDAAVKTITSSRKES